MKTATENDAMEIVRAQCKIKNLRIVHHPTMQDASLRIGNNFGHMTFSTWEEGAHFCINFKG